MDTNHEMQKVKIDEIVGEALNWAVARSAKVEVMVSHGCVFYKNARVLKRFDAHQNWAVAGPLIAEKNIGIKPHQSPAHGQHMTAASWNEDGSIGAHLSYGPDMLTAAMRCYVRASIEGCICVPKELL